MIFKIFGLYSLVFIAICKFSEVIGAVCSGTRKLAEVSELVGSDHHVFWLQLFIPVVGSVWGRNHQLRSRSDFRKSCLSFDDKLNLVQLSIQ